MTDQPDIDYFSILEPDDVKEFLEGAVWKCIAQRLKERLEGNRRDVDSAYRYIANDIGVGTSTADPNGTMTTVTMTPERALLMAACLNTRTEMLETFLSEPLNLLEEVAEATTRSADEERNPIDSEDDYYA